MSVEVVAYNSSTEGNVKVANNFIVKEFKSSDSKIVFIHKLLPQGLQKIRDKVGKAVKLTNAYRTDSHNKRVGGCNSASVRLPAEILYGFIGQCYKSPSKSINPIQGAVKTNRNTIQHSE